MVWTNWARTEAGGHPATLLCRRDAVPTYPQDGPTARCGEDLAAILTLKQRGALATLADAPCLYIYVAHGANTCSIAHHVMLIETLAISKGLLARRERRLREELRPLGSLGPVVVAGVNGPAFSL
jgi:hypothetical protein